MGYPSSRLIDTQWVITDKGGTAKDTDDSAHLVVVGYEEARFGIRSGVPSGRPLDLAFTILGGTQQSRTLRNYDARSAYLQLRGIQRVHLRLLCRHPPPSMLGDQVVQARGSIDGTRTPAEVGTSISVVLFDGKVFVTCDWSESCYVVLRTRRAPPMFHSHVDDILVGFDTSCQPFAAIVKKLESEIPHQDQRDAPRLLREATRGARRPTLRIQSEVRLVQ